MMRKIFLSVIFCGVFVGNVFAKDDLLVSYLPGNGVKFSTKDGRTYTQLFGDIQVNSANFMGDTKDLVSNSANLNNGIFVRMARIGLRGAMNSDWKYKFEYDAAISRLNYAYLNYVGWNHVELKVGEYRPSFSTNSLTGAVDHNFLERDVATQAFFLNYSVGSEVLFYKNSWTIAAGVFEPAFSTLNGINVTGSAPVGVNARLGVTPLHNHRDILHLGLGGYYHQAVNDEFAQFRTYPEMLSNNNTSVNLVSTGIINNSRNYYVSSAEAVNIFGSFAIDADYYVTQVNRSVNGPLTFDGYVVGASYFLTGEKRVYDYLHGEFTGVSKIQHAYGAWELAARYSCVDLNSKDIAGGKENNTTLALNWYPIEPIKFALNYIYANTDPSENGLDRHVHIIGLQMQASF